MKFIGIDPSFSSSGVAIYDSQSRKFSLGSIESKLGKGDFRSIFHSSNRIISNELGPEIYRVVERWGEVGGVVFEEPFTTSSFSVPLMVLDTFLARFLETVLPLKVRVYTSHPSFLDHIHGKIDKKLKKGVSLELGKRLVEILFAQGFSIDWVWKESHDAYEALFFLLHLLVTDPLYDFAGDLIKNLSIQELFGSHSVSQRYLDSFKQSKHHLILPYSEVLQNGQNGKKVAGPKVSRRKVDRSLAKVFQ